MAAMSTSIAHATKVRDYAKRGDATPVPDLTKVQADAYERFLQFGKGPDDRDTTLGLEALLREVYPIESYDGTMKLEYINYTLEEPRYTSDECRELRLTYGRPSRIGPRLKGHGKPQRPEEQNYRAELPI